MKNFKKQTSMILLSALIASSFSITVFAQSGPQRGAGEGGLGGAIKMAWSMYKNWQKERQALVEKETRNVLESIRAAIEVIEKRDGQPPKDLSEIFLKHEGGPPLVLPNTGHEPSSELWVVSRLDEAAVAEWRARMDSGQWIYIGDPKSPLFGSFKINCTHTDTNGKVWNSY